MANLAVNPPLSSLQPSANAAATVTNTLPQISTFQNQAFMMNQFMGIANVGFDDGAGPEWLDVFDPRVEQLLNNITDTTPQLDDISMPITTIAYRIFYTTTLWWFYLMFNGIIHPMERVGGARLYAGNVNQISSLANKINASSGANNLRRRGTVVKV